MKPNLQFDFLADKEKNTLTIFREFAANRQLVWDCYTKSELLDRWFAPKPFTTKTASMSFTDGGHWHYAMVSPEGEDYWGFTTYKNIQPIDSYETDDAFSDSTGKVNSDLPTAQWFVKFADKGANTTVKTTVQYATLADLETILNMGMKEGMTSTLECLDELLETLKSPKTANNLLFDFTVNKETQTVHIQKQFAAELPLVWDAFTKPELLDQWWAPKPFLSQTKSMNFEVGGRRFYAMVSPEGDKRWAIQCYTSISPKTNFKFLNAFADEAENPQLPGSDWDLNFSEENGITKVDISIYNESLTRMEMLIEMGFIGGMTATLESLGELLETLKPTEKTVISIETSINVAESRVWELYTSPEHILQWNTASDDWHTTAATNDLRVGGSFSSTMAAKDGSFSFDFAGIYNTVKKNQTIAYTLNDDRRVTITFTKKGETTVVLIDFEAETQNSVELQQAGWQAILDNFKKYAEANS
jgi:uncharacterized protein YndB with AHSA1/START domain